MSNTFSFRSTTGLLALAAALSLAPAALAQDSTYVSVSGGLNFNSDSDNEGVFPDGFTTGEGSAEIPAGTVLPPDTDVGWTTEFDTGFHINGAVGKGFGNGLRAELEVSYETADVDTHVGVTAAGLDLTAQDAAILTGGAEPLGATVGAVVADGQGDLTTLAVFANAYYDFENTSALTPYLGAGIGLAKTDVDYSPSAVQIIDDDDTGFAWQVMGGASYAVSPSTDLFAGVRYRSQEADVDASLFPAEFEVENDRILGEVGVRFRFN